MMTTAEIDVEIHKTSDNPILQKMYADFHRTELGDKDAHCEKHGAYITHGHHTKINGDEWTACPKCDAEALQRSAQENYERVQREAEIKRKHHFKACHIAPRYQGLDFASCKAVSPKHQAVINRFYQYAKQETRDMKNLIVHGNIGTGKTHLLCVVAQTRDDAQYWRLSDIMRRVKDTFVAGADETEHKVLKELSEVGLLIIDEIGRQNGSNFESNFIFDLIDNRYNNLLPTVLCSNLPVGGPPPNITTYIGPAAMDRINQNSAIVHCDWHNFRQGSEA